MAGRPQFNWKDHLLAWAQSITQLQACSGKRAENRTPPSEESVTRQFGELVFPLRRRNVYLPRMLIHISKSLGSPGTRQCEP